MEATDEAVAIAKIGPTADDPVEVIYANQAYLRTKGARMDQVVLGTNAMQFIGPRTDTAVLRRMREMLCSGQAGARRVRELIGWTVRTTMRRRRRSRCSAKTR